MNRSCPNGFTGLSKEIDGEDADKIIDLRNLFHNLIDEIKKNISLYTFIVFGSRSRGDHHSYSDYDVLIVADFKKTYFERQYWIGDLAPNIALDLFTYTAEEFDTLFHQYNLTAIDSIGEGIVLHGKDFYLKYCEKYKEFIRKGMKKDFDHEVLIPPSY